MENEDVIRGFDEATTTFMRTIPGFLWTFYDSLVKEGFFPDQAMELTKKYMDQL